MSENLTPVEEMLPSADSNESADSSGRNHSQVDYTQAHLSSEQLQTQARIEFDEKKEAEAELEEKLKFLKEMTGSASQGIEVENGVKGHYQKEANKSVEAEVKTVNEELKESGQSTISILKVLITRYQDNDTLSTWVDNWRSFIRLHEFAKAKPPTERRAIESIIARADFSSSTSFTETLVKIKESEEISSATKREINQKFDPSHITSIMDMDRRLNKVKIEQRLISRELTSFKIENDKVVSSKRSKVKQLKGLPVDDPKREKLEQEIQQLEQQEAQISKQVTSLEVQRKTTIGFELRPNYHVSLDNNGNRTISYEADDFVINLPSNRLPFQSLKNIRSVNTAFVFMPLHNAGMTDILFCPPLKSGSIPSKQHRDMSHFILSHLGYNDDVILSPTDISKLTRHLATLKTTAPKESGKYNLVELGIYDKFDDMVNMERLGEHLEGLITPAQTKLI